MTRKVLCSLYAASCVEDGGIYIYSFSKDGELKYRGKLPLDRPMYMASAGKCLYTVLRQPFPDKPDSAIVALDILPDGKLAKNSGPRSTQGGIACHLLVDGDDMYLTNYISGSVVKMPDTLVVHKGKGVHPQRQTSPHTHQAVFSPDKRFVCVTDLGLDKIFVYDRGLALRSEASVPAGHGARHMVFSPDGNFAFCANELASTVSSFFWNSGVLEHLGTVDALPGKDKSQTTSAAIRLSPDGNYLYTSNRGDDSISCFRVCGGEPRLFDIVNCEGRTPRDFIFSPDGKYLICANEDSDNLSIFEVVEGQLFLLNSNPSIRKPVCVLFWEKME